MNLNQIRPDALSDVQLSNALLFAEFMHENARGEPEWHDNEVRLRKLRAEADARRSAAA